MDNLLNSINLPLNQIKTPSYVADLPKIKENLAIAKKIKDETGCKIILATKAFSMFSIYPQIAQILDGTTASGIYEARLDREEFGKEIHVYSPAYKEDEIDEIIKISDNIYFNSVNQLEKFYSKTDRKTKNIGLRVNPQINLVKNNQLYNPSSKNSRFGVQIEEINDDTLNKIDILHIHNLCENLDHESLTLINHIDQKMSHLLKRIKYLNIGGGHYYTHPNYNTQNLIKAINQIQDKYNLKIIIESGATVVYEAGYLVSEVIDIVENKETPIAILDTSATCHMPDVLEVPYRPNVIGSDDNYQYQYIFGGSTCLTGDIIGNYSFKDKLKIGDKVIFSDMMQYSFVKNNTFNGVKLPSLAVFDGKNYKVIKEFGYQDFKNRLS